MGVFEITVENWEKCMIAHPDPLENGAKMHEELDAPLCCLRWEVDGM
jgi:hypothetical protein